jgi:hypothetical protein
VSLIIKVNSTNAYALIICAPSFRLTLPSEAEVCEAMGAGKSTMDKWVRQLRGEHNGISPQAHQ